MYVCICNSLTDRQVRSAVGAGARNTREVYRHFGCSCVCGKCMPMIRTLISSHEAASNDDGFPLAAE